MNTTFNLKNLILKSFIVMVALALLLIASYGAALAEIPIVSFEYLYDLTGFGTDGQFDEPNDIFIEGKWGEVYIADSRHHRVKIFNLNGMMLFQFGSTRSMAYPRGVAVDSRGVIYVNHLTGNRPTITMFNYRGVFLKKVTFEDVPLDVPIVNASGIAVDGADRLYVLDDQDTIKRVMVFAPDGTFIKLFRIMADLDEKLTRESFCGKPFVAHDGILYVPNPMVGTVYVYSPEGEFIRNIGIKGGGPGKLAFPVDVAIDSRNQVLVLDRMRHTVVFYTREGKYISEHGGFGLSDGWFYAPNSIAVDPKDRVYVSQVLNDRVQVLQVHSAGAGINPISLTTESEEGGESRTSQRGPKNTF